LPLAITTRLISLLFLLLAGFPAWAQDKKQFELAIPVICEFGKTCWIQQYPDHDAGTGAKNYLCGASTYDGHDGTDFRVLDTSKTAAVVAAAPGVVQGTRDGVPDRLMKTEADKTAVANRECGNGVLIEHADGWQTQYCHMKSGSVAVKKGEKVKAGTQLGKIGFSGAVEFPHLHLTVRKNKKVVDPFSGMMSEDCSAEDKPIWSPEALSKLAYVESAVLQVGLSDRMLKKTDLESGNVPGAAPSADWPLIQAFASAINLANGDKISLRLDVPNAEPVLTEVILDRNKAFYIVEAHQDRPAEGWPQGQYKLSFIVSSGTVMKLSEQRTFEMGK
jgi:Peptidase family M23